MDVDKIARIQQLLSIRKNITSFFTERYEDLQSMKECHSISTDNILEFARYTTFTLKAPEGWVPGMPLIGGHPPAPQPDQMRDGALQRYNQQYSKLLKEGTEKKETTDHENNLESLHIKENLKRTFISDQSKESVQSDGIHEEPVDKSFHKDLAEKSVVIPEITIKAHVPPQIKPVLTPAVEQPTKRSRQINISFGLSDSESSDEEAE